MSASLRSVAVIDSANTHTQTHAHTEAGEVQNDNKGYLRFVLSYFQSDYESF